MNGDEGRIKGTREAAARARRLSSQLSLREDRDRVLAFAEELDAQADALERSLAAAPTPPVARTQVQMQVQQQGGSAGEKPEDDPASKA